LNAAQNFLTLIKPLPKNRNGKRRVVKKDLSNNIINELLIG